MRLSVQQHLMDNIKALELELTPEQIEKIESGSSSPVLGWVHI